MPLRVGVGHARQAGEQAVAWERRESHGDEPTRSEDDKGSLSRPQSSSWHKCGQVELVHKCLASVM